MNLKNLPTMGLQCNLAKPCIDYSSPKLNVSYPTRRILLGWNFSSLFGISSSACTCSLKAYEVPHSIFETM